MMIEAPRPERVDVAVVVENDAVQIEGVSAVATLRRKGLSAELFAQGGARKRYDKALKTSPCSILSLDLAEAAVTARIKPLDPAFPVDLVEATLSVLPWFAEGRTPK